MTETVPVPDCIKDVFVNFPHVRSVVWDGEVKVNGSTVGPPEVFEELWDFFVDKPHCSFMVEDGLVKEPE